MIVVIDYNVGNVRSVCNALRHIGCETELTVEPEKIRAADGLILPGVAAFGYAVKALGRAGGQVKQAALAGKPLLGICVGYQLLFDESCEHGVHAGLGLIGGRVVPIPPGRTIPHMGWNRVEMQNDMDLFTEPKTARHFYFAHSYYADIADPAAVIAFTDYGFQLPAAVQKANVYGTQFHPEKSGPQGLEVLKAFAGVCGKKRREEEEKNCLPNE